VSSILVDKSSSAAQASTDSWADVTDLLQASVSGGAASSVLLMIATVPLLQGDTADDVAEFRFAIDDVREGPQISVFKDTTDKGCGVSLCWALTGIGGTHKFAIQWISVASKHAATDTGRERSFQVIEITDANLLVSKTSNAADDADAGFTDIIDLTDTKTVAAGSVLILLGQMPPKLTSAEFNMGCRFTIAGTFEGPELTAFNDATDEGCGQSMMWMKDGISGSTAFALQWNEVHGVISADTAVRSLQVIEITANVALHENSVTQSAHTLTGSYADIANMTATFSINSTNSIILLAAGIAPEQTGDRTGSYRFADGGTDEGPENYIFGDSATGPDACGHSLYYAVTGKSADSHTFTLQGINVSGTVTMDQGRNRSFCALELKEVAADSLPARHRRMFFRSRIPARGSYAT